MKTVNIAGRDRVHVLQILKIKSGRSGKKRCETSEICLFGVERSFNLKQLAITSSALEIQILTYYIFIMGL